MRRNDDIFPVRRAGDWNLAPGTETGGFLTAPFSTGSPWQMLRRMQEDMDRLFSQFFEGPAGTGTALAGLQQQWSPSIDVSEGPNEWRIEADLPGVKKDDIHVHVQNHQLHLRADMRQREETPQGGQTQGGQAQGGEQQRQYYRRERRYGFLERVMPLPPNADEENIRCELRDGVLRIHLPKVQPAAPQGRRIPIGEGETTRAAQPGRITGAGQTTGQRTFEQPAGTEAATATRGSNGRKATVAGTKGGQSSTPRKPRGRKGTGGNEGNG